MSEDAALIASAVGDEAFTENELRAVIDDLKMDTGRAARLLNELGSFPDVDVRLWVPGAAREVLGEACLPLLIRMTKDPEIDVQDAAIEELVKLGPNAANTIVSDLRRKLKSTDIHEPVFAMWKLFELGDRESLPLIRALAEAPEGDYPLHNKTARVICMLMENPRQISEGIRSHDHELMQWLTMAARDLRTDEAHAALEECARSAPDRDCRQMRKDALAFWESSD